jgi:hypothetical protein
MPHLSLKRWNWACRSFPPKTTDDQVRRARLNSSLPRSLKPSAMGDSVGLWQDDTLVVEAAGCHARSFCITDRFEVPVTKALHLVWWRLTA